MAVKDASDFLKQLGDRVVEDLPATSKAGAQTGLDGQVPALVVETRSPLLAREVVSHPFAPGKSGDSKGGGILADLRPKVTAIGADGKPWKSWAPFGEPGTPRLGKLELGIAGGLLGTFLGGFLAGMAVGRRKHRP